MQSLSMCDLKGTAMIALASQCYSTMMYWLPFLDITGNRPMSSVYSLLMWVVLMWISFCPLLGNPSGGIGSVSLLCFLVGLVDRTCFLVWTICPFIFSFQVGQYLVAFWYVNPGHKSKFPSLIYFSLVSWTGNSADAWKYRIRASTVGIL